MGWVVVGWVVVGFMGGWWWAAWWGGWLESSWGVCIYSPTHEQLQCQNISFYEHPPTHQTYPKSLCYYTYTLDRSWGGRWVVGWMAEGFVGGWWWGGGWRVHGVGGYVVWVACWRVHGVGAYTHPPMQQLQC